MSGSTRSVAHGDVSLATEAFGDPQAPALLLIMGATASRLWWPEALCQALAEAGRYVVRYDNRDTGQSTSYDPGPPPYSLDDMAEDALAVLEGYGLAQAHVVGMSLGGMIAQILALKHPSRVATLTALSSARFDEDSPDLPPIDPTLLAHFGTLGHLDWTDRDAVIAFHTETYRLSAGARTIFDEAAARDLAGREYDRALRPQSAMNHMFLGGGEAWFGQLGQLQAPLLVIHGRHDPVLSFAHGERLAQAVPTSRLVALEEAGHELNPRDWPRIVHEITTHTHAPRPA